MRYLLVIPHAYLGAAGGTRRYGSERSDPATRAAALLRCVAGLHECFGGGQHLVATGNDPRCNATTAATLEIVVCVTGGLHVAHDLPAHLARQHATAFHPRLLGFAAQTILRDNAGRYDWFGYLEDDCEITDPLLFAKLAWFNAQFGPGALLQPNRYERSNGPVVQKLYIDGRVAGAGSTAADFRAERPGPPRLQASAFGRDWQFRRVSNPHSGCFFADAAQMARMAADPAFGTYSDAFIGPLESAATLPILRNFAVYKPARENAAFLEIRHLDQRILDQRLFFSVNARGEIVRRVVAEDC